MKDEIKKITLTKEINTVDLHTMYQMPDEEYREFLQNEELFYIDPHNALRSAIVDYPLAMKLSQLNILIEELEKMRVEMI